MSSILRKDLPYNVVVGARKRIINAFSNGLPIYLSVSGGKDSIVLSDLVLSLIKEGRVDPSLLTVQFIDEEAMHEPVIQNVHRWRREFIAEGAKFDWYCIEVKHFNCFNNLTQDESFICWDSTMPERWVRKMPSSSHYRRNVMTLTPATGWVLIAAFGVLSIALSAMSRRKVALTRKEFLLVNRDVSVKRGAFSIAATWIWAPALFVAA